MKKLRVLKKKKICYHGTNKKNAESILKNGFKPGTWFSPDMAIALNYGGNYVFTLEVEYEPRSKGFLWQFVDFDGIPVDAIIRLEKIDREKLFGN